MKRFLQNIFIAFMVSLPFIGGGFLLQGQSGAGSSSPAVRATLTPDSISIGDHIRLTVEVDKDIMQLVDFPVFQNNKLGEQIVIIKEGPVDTVKAEGRRQKLIKEYLLTCFDAGLYGIGSFPVLYADKNIVDTLFSEDSLTLLVTTFPVDTMMNTIYDIKKPEETPLLVSEFSGYMKLGILALCLLTAIIWLISRRLASRGRRDGDKPDTAPKEPPHIRAIRDLEALNSQKLWQSNKHKLYYTRLTDIIRTYIEGRYGIGAMEMTTDEIMTALGQTPMPEKGRKDLHEILRTSDLVKFAKYVPEGDDNEQVYYKAYYFVEETKEIPEQVQDERSEEGSGNEE